MAYFYDPFSELRRIQRQMDRMFDDSYRIEGSKSGDTQLATTSGSTGPISLRDWRPVIDVREGEKQMTIHAELPGVPKENVSIDLNDDILTISGSRNHEKKEDKETYHLVERSYGSFSRSMRLPKGNDPSKINASFKDGVLEVSVPKPENLQLNQKINIA